MAAVIEARYVGPMPAVGAEASTHDLVLQANATWVGTFSVEDSAGESLDLTDCEIEMTLWDPDGNVVLELSSPSDGIVLDEDAGDWTWVVTITDEQTAAMSIGGIYQCYVVYDDGSRDRTHQGNYTLKRHGSLC